jgi:hypothetical protein
VKKPAIANPSSPRGETTPVVLVTSADDVSDRANRYRANEVLAQLPSSHRNVCHWCGKSGFAAKLMAGHVDGYEEHNDPANVSPTCRPCNNALAAHFTRAGVGRLTRQFNPAAKAAANPEDYAGIVAAMMTEEHTGRLRAAIRRMQATPHASRNAYARELRTNQRQS